MKRLSSVYATLAAQRLLLFLKESAIICLEELLCTMEELMEPTGFHRLPRVQTLQPRLPEETKSVCQVCEHHYGQVGNNLPCKSQM